jgi:hypothetical protein
VPLHPVARRRNPRRVPDYLARLALAYVYRVLLHPDADEVGLNFLSVLPEREAERRHVERELYVGLTGLELRALDAAARELVLALRLEAVVAYVVLLRLRGDAREGRQSDDEGEPFKNPSCEHE